MKNIKRKVVSVVTALGLLASSMPAALAATSKYHTSSRDSYGNQYYTDKYKNKVYDGYIVDQYGNTFYRNRYGVSFDDRDNAIIDVNAYYMYENGNVNSNWNNGFQNNENQGLNDYLDYLSSHLNIDADPANLNRIMEAHTQTCVDMRCITGYALYKNYFQTVSNTASNQQNNGNEQFIPQNPTETADTLYTLVKTVGNKTVYAYAKDQDVTKYGIYGWTCNSVYNANDYSLNSVFYEEINSFGNAISSNPYITSAINANTDLYVWNYVINGQNHWCVSPVQDPAEINKQIAPYTNVRFSFVSEYNMNDVNVDLKTSSTVLDSLGFDPIMNVQQIQEPIYIYQR